jgi:hypothetical protein
MRRAILAAAFVSGCSAAPEPEQVFVPGPSFGQEVLISSSRGTTPRVAVGEPLVLHAVRHSGPWVPARRKDLPADACWVAQPPPGEEAEVADNLRWIAEPDGAATFNVAYRMDHTREVRFSAPGEYRLRAIGTFHCTPPCESDTITVSVLPRPGS